MGTRYSIKFVAAGAACDGVSMALPVKLVVAPLAVEGVTAGSAIDRVVVRPATEDEINRAPPRDDAMSQSLDSLGLESLDEPFS